MQAIYTAQLSTKRHEYENGTIQIKRDYKPIRSYTRISPHSFNRFHKLMQAKKARILIADEFSTEMRLLYTC